jgi:hypothetical protein
MLTSWSFVFLLFFPFNTMSFLFLFCFPYLIFSLILKLNVFNTPYLIYFVLNFSFYPVF